MKEVDLSSVKEVKLKWKKLRDSYRDALKRQSDMLAKEGGNPGKKTYPWKYMSQMQFLQPYMSNRKKPAETPPTPVENGNNVSSEESESEEESSGKRKESLRVGPLQYLMGSLPPGGSGRKREHAPDPLDTFFNGMCQSTKRLPFPAQIKIKRVLFNAVAEAEEALIADHHAYAALWARAPMHAQGSSSSSEGPDHNDDDKTS